MFENLKYEKFKKANNTKMILENNQAMTDAMLKYRREYLKDRQMTMADTKVILEQDKLIRAEYEKRLNDSLARVDAINTIYRKMWADAFDVIENDPVLKAYREKNNLTISQALNQLADKYGRDTALGKQLLSMERMTTALGEISKLDQVKERQTAETTSANLMNIFLTELNNTNGRTLGSDATKKSLSEEAYEQLDSTEYAGVDKDQDLLIAVHLGQICSDMVSQVTKIEAMAPLLHGEDELAKQDAEQNDYENFVKDFPGSPEEFFSGMDAEIAKQNEIIREYETFRDDNAYNPRTIKEKYAEFLAKAVANTSKDEIQEKYESQLEDRNDTLKNLRIDEENKNDITRRQNEELKQRHQEDLKHNKEVREAIAEVEKDKALVLEGFDKQIAEKQEAENKYLLERETKGKELEQQWKDYDKKLNDAKKNLEIKEKAVEERNKLEAEVSRLAPKGNEIAELETSRRMAQTFLDMIVGIEKGIDGKAGESNVIGNAALRSKDLTADDIFNAPDELKDNIKKALNVQATWSDFKNTHNQYSSFFHYVDDFKGVKASSTEHGPMDELYKQFETWKAKVTQLEKVVNPYLGAKKKIEELNLKNNGLFVTEEEVDAKRKEVEQLAAKTPTQHRFDRKEWDKETKAGLDPEISELKNKRNKEEESYNLQIESYKEKLKDETEPIYFTLKTEDEINKIVEKEKEKLLSEEVLKKVKADITKKVYAKNESKAILELNGSLSLKATKAKNKIQRIKETNKKIEDMFKADQLRTRTKQEFTDGLKAQAVEFGNRKSSFYTMVGNDLSKYFGNMEKGKKAGHTNSDEFTEMCDQVKNAADMFDPSENHTLEEQLKALEDMKKAADFYKAKKEHDFHIEALASPMRRVRLRMAEDLSRFAVEKVKEIKDFEKLSATMQKHLESLKPEAALFDVKTGDVDAASHFKRIFKTKQQEKQLEASKNNINEKPEKADPLMDDTDVVKSSNTSRLGPL